MSADDICKYKFGIDRQITLFPITGKMSIIFKRRKKMSVISKRRKMSTGTIEISTRDTDL